MRKNVRTRYKDTDYFVDKNGKAYRNGKEVGYDRRGRIMVRFGRKGQSVLREKMIAETFLGLKEGQQVHHKNGVTSDDRVENLLCVSPLQHKRIHNSSVITLQFDGSWNLLAAYNSKSDAERAMGYNAGALRIKEASDERKMLLGFHWLYLDNLPERFIFATESVAQLRMDLLKYAYSQLLTGREEDPPMLHRNIDLSSMQALKAVQGIIFS